MIEVQNLTKRYSGRTAVDTISFEVGKGEIVGFLGPNGAGKSTTMRMLTCFLSATEGSAKVAGFDIYDDSIEVRRHLGYMPENVPLYLDMRVTEYLRFRARLKGLRNREAKRSVEDVMETCSLSEVSHKMISTLSKGYRQRVGLADALINKPDLLILDEPTNGLDPNQIRQSRELIRRLGEEHTILLSTHILSEVEMTCGRVVIIDQGKIRASDTPQELIRRLRRPGELLLEVEGDEEKILSALGKIPAVHSVEKVSYSEGWIACTLRVDPQADVRVEVSETIIRNGGKIRELASRAASLEDAFVDLVQHSGPDPRYEMDAPKSKSKKKPKAEPATSEEEFEPG